jgi:hypothetical protein
MTAEIASPRLPVQGGGGSGGIGIPKSLTVTSLTVDGATQTGAGWAVNGPAAGFAITVRAQVLDEGMPGPQVHFVGGGCNLPSRAMPAGSL